MNTIKYDSVVNNVKDNNSPWLHWELENKFKIMPQIKVVTY